MPTKHEEIMVDRKARHLEICLDDQRYHVEGGDTGLGGMRFVHRALTEVKASEIDTGVDFLGKRIALPLFISSMTGGSEHGYRLNKVLAQVAQDARIPVGMGSIRILFRKPEVFPHFHLKAIAPDVPVVANLGAVQIRDMVQKSIVEMIKKLEVDALAIHINPAQELFQPEGDRDFSGLVDGIRRFCEKSPVPVIVKETGCGLGVLEISRLIQAGVSLVNVAGSGGTNWINVESYRTDGVLHRAAQDFAHWGLGTGIVLAALRRLEETQSLPWQTPPRKETVTPRGSVRKAKGIRPPLLQGRILASGGIRTSQDLAKSLALGALAAGTALPFIRAVDARGAEGGLELVEYYRTGLVNAMVLTGASTLEQFRHQSLMTDLATAHQIDQYVSSLAFAL